MDRMKTLDVSAEEAWYISHKPYEEEWKHILIADRGTSEFRDVMRSLTGQGVTFTCNGDEIVFARVSNVWAPWDMMPRRWTGEADNRAQGKWTIELDPECWRRIPPDNTGYWQHRIADGVPDEFALIERSLAEAWKDANDIEQSIGVNHGCGILQDMMLSTHRHEKPKSFDPWLTNRERKIVATVVQWLGTNCGKSFLYEASRRMGRPKYPFTKSSE